MQPFQVAALALPVADGEVDKLKLRNIAEVGNRKHRLEHRLQPAVLALAGQFVHLQEAVIGALLNLDQVRDLDGCWNLGKVETLAVNIVFWHSKNSCFQAAWGCGTARNVGAKSRRSLLPSLLLNERTMQKLSLIHI